MFDNIGGKIKGLAKVLFWLQVIAAVIVGFVLVGDTEGLSLLFTLAGVPVASISAWFLYGFGEIIDKLCDIERNTRGGETKSEAQSKVDSERVNKIEKMRSQGLITEEEYQQAISKEQWGTNIDRQIQLRYKSQIVILSIVALVFKALSSIYYFTTYESVWRDGYEISSKLSFQFPNILQLSNIIPLFFLVLDVLPYILLVIYVQKFHKEFKATVVVPVIFASIAIVHLLNLIINIIYGYGFIGSIINLITSITLAITFALATISALKGLSNKIFIVIPTVVGLVSNLLSLIGTFYNFSYYISSGSGMHLYSFTFDTSSIIASFALYVALLIFGLKNRIPTILSLSPEEEKKNAEKMTPEQALIILKGKFKLGMITEEEYQTQRAEIISKL